MKIYIDVSMMFLFLNIVIYTSVTIEDFSNSKTEPSAVVNQTKS